MSFWVWLTRKIINTIVCRRHSRALRWQGVKYEYKFYNAGERPLRHVFYCNIKDERARAANKGQPEFFKKLMK